jgi:tetratricopeptide (TPR) repeat protein
VVSRREHSRRRRLTRVLGLALLLWTSFAADGVAAGRTWRLIRGKNVIVLGQQSAGTLRGIAVEIEQFRSVLGGLIKGARQPLSVPTQVFIFDDYDGLRPFVPLYQGKPAVLGGFCHCASGDDVSFIAAGLSEYAESSAIIYHEYTHLLVRNAVSSIPVWLNEGLAEYFSTFSLRANGREAQIGRPIARHVQLLRERYLPIAQIIQVDQSSELYNEGSRRSIFYAEAWALTHYLVLERPDGQAAIAKYLAVLAAGAKPNVALEQAVGVPLKDLDTELRRYVAKPTFKTVTYALSDPVEVDEPGRAQEIAAADADARLGEMQMRVGRMDEAVRRIEAAATVGPSVGHAQLALAFLRLRQARAAEAWALLDKAAALAPDDFIAQYTYALALLRGNPDSTSAALGSVERARSARAALVRALKAHPESAAALAWLAYADTMAGENLAEARDATRRAVALAPGRLDYTLQLAEIELRTGNTDDGRRLLTQLAKAATDENVAARAATILERLNRVEESRGAVSDTASAPPNPPPPNAMDHQLSRFRLRDLGDGEERAYGELTEIGCGPNGVYFRLRADGREVIATASRMEDVALTAFGKDKDFVIACGVRRPPDKVYVTRRGETAVAVEFLPQDYVP